tara:strand:+ start:152 stop:856 length:705 start_codon:yes stop_codon:yes gene_type:complete
MNNVLITGASRGIGLEIAKSYYNGGYSVLTTSTSNWMHKNINPREHFQVNFNNEESMDAFLKKLKKYEIDILINNAGINKIDSFVNVKLEDFIKIQNVNVIAPFRICQVVIPKMKKKKFGRIVGLSSIWGKRSKEFRSSYSASKFAIDGLIKAIALEYSKHGILANSVAPGFIDTELTRKILTKDQINYLTSLVPIKRFGTSEEVAKFIKWLGSKENTYITAQNLAIDGGYTSA